MRFSADSPRRKPFAASDGSASSKKVKIDHPSHHLTLHHVAMKVTERQALAARCPTCSAKPREKCELATGQPRTSPIGIGAWRLRTNNLWQQRFMSAANFVRTTPSGRRKDEAVSDDCPKLSSFSNDLRLPCWDWKPKAVLYGPNGRQIAHRVRILSQPFDDPVCLALRA